MIATVTVTGDQVAWTVSHPSPHGDKTMIFHGTLSGSSMSGTVEHTKPSGEAVTSKWSGQKGQVASQAK
jgi:hypothetical protein